MRRNPSGKFTGSFTEVKGDNLKGAMRKMKKMLVNDGMFREMRNRQHFVKPSVLRAQAKKAARRRHLKELESRDD